MAPLSVHDTLAHYAIRARLGEGGMGEVFLADDLRLRRPVALKVLKPHEQSPEAVERFIAEAQAASALNHPNVAHIYEIAHLDERVYIAMEYVDGVTLEERLQKGPLPISEIMELATQLADALTEAAAKNIVHRDLKPANIVVNRRGQAKILDFGIARVSGYRDTDPRVVFGTAPYMSPEQTRGEAVDPRSDLFAFGVVLYEMVTGRRPFDGDSIIDTFQRIAALEPPEIDRADVPPVLRSVIARCLEKDREKRYASPAEMLAALRRASARAQGGGLRPALPWAAAVLVLAALAFFFATRGERPAAPAKLTRITSAPGLEDEPALSPDGRMVAYTSDERGNLDVFVAPARGGEAVRITTSEADDAQPAWSPDGKRLAFVSARERAGRLSIVLGQALGSFVNTNGGDLFVQPVAGGAAVKIAEQAFYPAWSPDGAWIVFQSARGGRWDIWKVRANGGDPVQLTHDAEFDYQPSWSPDGKSIVYGSGMPAPYRLKMISASGGAPRVISDGKDRILLKPTFTSDGRALLFSSQRGGSINLWRLALGGRAPEQLTLGEGDDVNPSTIGKWIVYAAVRQMPDLWTYDLRIGATAQVTAETGREEFPHRSREGVLVFTSDRGGSDALWLRDAQGALKRFVTERDIGQARWSPDGRRIAYRYAASDGTHIIVQQPGSTERQFIARDAEAPAWSPDGARLAFTSWAGMRKSQIFVTSVSDPQQRRQVTSLDLICSYPSWSPDGRLLSFQATRDDGTRHIWMVDVATGRARPLTAGASEDSHPNWSPVDPEKILFVRNHENLATVEVSTGRVALLTRYAEPNMVLDYPAWSPDGSKVDYSIARKRGDLYLIER